MRFDARADERRVRTEERHRLALHVRTHERAVRVVVLEERNQRSGDRHQLVRRHVHQLDFFGLDDREVTLTTEHDEIVRELAGLAVLRRRLRDDLVLFFGAP